MVGGKLKVGEKSEEVRKDFKVKDSLAISTELRGSMAPQFGRTQYFFGAVVLILNKTFFSVGFLRLMCDVTGCVNGPGSEREGGGELVIGGLMGLEVRWSFKEAKIR
jgi:hypothetical protein